MTKQIKTQALARLKEESATFTSMSPQVKKEIARAVKQALQFNKDLLRRIEVEMANSLDLKFLTQAAEDHLYGVAKKTQVKDGVLQEVHATQLYQQLAIDKAGLIGIANSIL